MQRRGAVIVEVALTLPILLYLAFGTVEFGYYFYVKHALEAAAREGARAGIVSGNTNTDVTTAVTNAMASTGIATYSTTITDTANANVTVNTVAAGSYIKVTVNANWGTVGMRPLQLIGSSKTVTGQMVMRHE